MIPDRSQMANIFAPDDDTILEKFIQGTDRLLASANLRLEVNGALSQLMSKHGDLVAIMYLQNQPRSVIVKHSSPFLEPLDRLLISKDFVMFGDASRPGFIEYKHYVTPAGYRVWYTDPAILWKKWWPTERFQNKQRFNMDILVNFKSSWYPVQNINLNAGVFTIKTIAGQLILKREDKVLWLAQKIDRTQPATTGDLESGSLNTTIEPTSVVKTGFHTRSAEADLAKKIQQKQSGLNSEQGWAMIKQLEQKLQVQLEENRELEEKIYELDRRSIIAEQRLQVVYNYLREIGIDPQELHHQNRLNYPDLTSVSPSGESGRRGDGETRGLGDKGRNI